MNLASVHPKATPQHRLAGYALEAALALMTCGIGWLVWSLVVWNQGQTPAKQILKMRVVSSNTGRQATWGHMAIRQFLIPLTFSVVFNALSSLLGAGSTYDSMAYLYGASLFVSLLAFVFGLLDAFWIFVRGENRRITDLWAKTDVLNIAATLPSARPFTPSTL